MLAFAKDITISDPHHPQEAEDEELKRYMIYQRALNHKRIVYYSLEHGSNLLKLVLKKARKAPETLDELMEIDFPNARLSATPETLKGMLKTLVEDHNSTTKWYRITPYYYTLIYDCMKGFLEKYNALVNDSPHRAEVYYISEGKAIDFEDWIFLFFNDLDFHVGRKLDNLNYPFSKRNEAIQDEIDKSCKKGRSFEEALKDIQEDFQMEDVSIRILLGKVADVSELQLLHTPMENRIYDYLQEKQKGSWEALEGESIMDQSYAMGAKLKVWIWKGKKGKRRGNF